MKFLSSLSALILHCYLYSSLTTGQTLESISKDELLRQLQELDLDWYKGYLLLAIPAASAGKNLFNIPLSVSEDCTRTAKVILQAFFKPSTEPYALAVFQRSINQTVKQRNGYYGIFGSQVDTVCQNMDKEAKIRAPVFGDFEELKKAVRVPKPAKNYMVDIPAGQNVTEWIRTRSVPLVEREMFQFQVIMRMRIFRNMQFRDQNQRESFITVRAIDLVVQEMPENDSLELDKVIMETLEDFVTNPPTQLGDKIYRYNDAVFTSAFLKKVDQHLLNNDLLKKEYDSMKKKATNELARNRPMSISHTSQKTGEVPRSNDDKYINIYQ